MTKNLYTERLDLRIPTMKEQKRLWEILIIEDVNKYYFPTPDRIFNKNNLKKDDINDLKKARIIFMEQLSDWDRQEPFYGQITCQPKEDENELIRDVGWYIDPQYQGHGYATEAASKMLDYMFNEIGIEEIKTSAAKINIGSWKIMEKLGFEYIGDKKSTYFDGDEILISKEYFCNKKMFNDNKK